MVSNALIGFLGVILGSVTTSVLTALSLDVSGRPMRNCALVSVLMNGAPFNERACCHYRTLFRHSSRLSTTSKIECCRSGSALGRGSRTWLTPTATGWQSVELRVETMAARVFDDDLRSISAAICTASRDAVWASSAEDSEHAGGEMKALNRRFNLRLSSVLPDLYR